MSTYMIHQAIVTKFIGPTNFRGSRVKATAAAGNITVHWDPSKNPSQNHAAAAKALAEKFGWTGDWHAGGMPNDSGYCFVCSQYADSPVFTTLPPSQAA